MPRRFGFDQAGLGFDLGPFGSGVREQPLELQAKTLPSITGTAIVGRRLAGRVQITADATLPALSASAELNVKPLIEAVTVLPALTSTVVLGRRDRINVVETCVDILFGMPDSYDAGEINFFNVFPAVPASVLEGNSSSIIIGLSFSDSTGFGYLQILSGQLLPSVETGPAALRLVAGNGEVQLSGPDAPGSITRDPDNPYSWVMGQPDRDRLGAWLASYQGDAVTLRICTAAITVQGHRVASLLGKFGALSAPTSTLDIRAPALLEIQASRSLPGISGIAPVSKVQRHEVEATATFSEIASTANVQVLDLTVLLTPAAIAFEPIKITQATVQTRAPQRNEIRASFTAPILSGSGTVLRKLPIAVNYAFGAMVTALTVSKRLSERHVLEAARTLLAIGHTAAIQTTAPSRKAIIAEKAFAAFSAAVAVNNHFIRVQIDAAAGLFLPHEVATDFLRIRAPPRLPIMASLNLPALSDQATVAIREPARHSINAAGTLPEPSSTADVLRTIRIDAALTLPALVATTNVFARQPARHVLAVAAKTFVESRRSALLSSRRPKRIEIQSQPTFSAITSTTTLYRELPVTATATLAALSATATLAVRAPERHFLAPSSTFGAIVATAPVRTRAVDRRLLEGSLRFEEPVRTAVISRLEPVQHPITATGALPALSSTVELIRRRADRHLIEADATLPDMSATVGFAPKRLRIGSDHTFAAATMAVDLFTRTAMRRELRAAPMLAAMSSVGTVLGRMVMRHQLAASATQPQISSAATVYLKTPVSAALALPGALSTAVLNTRTPVERSIEVSGAFGQLTLAATVENRPANRIRIVAGAMLPAISSTAAMAPKRLPVEAAGVFAAVSSSGEIKTHEPARHSIEADGALPVASGLVGIRTRGAVRHRVAGAITLPSFSYTAEIAPKKLPVLGSRALPALTGATDVDIRLPARHAAEASRTFPVQDEAAEVNKRDTPRHSIEAATTVPPASATSTVEKKISIDGALVFGGIAGPECVDLSYGIPTSHSTTEIFFNSTFPVVPASVLVGDSSTIIIQFALNASNGTASLQLLSGEFLAEIERLPNAFRLVAGNGEVSIGGPDAPGNIGLDPDNPMDGRWGSPTVLALPHGSQPIRGTR